MIEMKFRAKIWYWRGPSPYFFVTVPVKHCRTLQAIAELVTYGWGMIPVAAQIGETQWTTSLFPKEGRYIVPLKDSVRKAEDLGEGNTITVHLQIRIKA